MIAVVDTSVLLRQLLGEPDALVDWPAIDEAFVSRLVEVEIGRVIDRYRLAGTIDDADVEHLHAESRMALRSMNVVAVTDAILMRAGRPDMPPEFRTT